MTLRTFTHLLWCGMDEGVRLLDRSFRNAFLVFAVILLFLTPGFTGAQVEHKVSAKRGENLKQATSIFGNGFEVQGGEGGNPCDHPLVKPTGWRMVSKTWAQCFTPRDGSPVPTYPNGLGFPIPLGANKGEYTVCKFTALPNTVTNLFFDPAQANPGQGYYVARPAMSMMITVSACAGDFRMTPGCSISANTGTLITSTKHGPSNFYCSLTAGLDYYYTVAPVDPSDGLTPGEHTCNISAPSSNAGCDVQTRQTSN